MKKLCLILVIFIFCCTSVFSEDNIGYLHNNIKQSIVMFIGSNDVFINGDLDIIDENKEIVPFITNGRTLVPIRFIIEQLYGKVLWKEETEQIEILIGGKTLLLQIGNSTIFIDGKSKAMETAPVLLNERTFVPFRVISEESGKKVYFLDDTIIISDEETGIGSLSLSDQTKVVKLLKRKTYFENYDYTYVHIDVKKLDDYLYQNPVSGNSFLSYDRKLNLIPVSGTGKTNLPGTGSLDKLMSDNNMKIKRIQNSFFLGTDNILYHYALDNYPFSRSRVSYEQLKITEIEKDVDKFSVYHNLAVILKNDGNVITTEYPGGRIYHDYRHESQSGPYRIPYSEYVPVIELKEYPFTDVSGVFAGMKMCFVTKKDGSLWAWGNNNNGQLGIGNYENQSEPVEVKGVKNVKYIAANIDYAICITEDGSLWVWGLVEDLSLGKLFSGKSNVPVKIKGISDVAYVSSDSNSRTVVVKNDGTVWVCGTKITFNRFELYDYEEVDQFVQITGISDALYADSTYIINNRRECLSLANYPQTDEHKLLYTDLYIIEE